MVEEKKNYDALISGTVLIACRGITYFKSYKLCREEYHEKYLSLNLKEGYSYLRKQVPNTLSKLLSFNSHDRVKWEKKQINKQTENAGIFYR